MKRYILIILLFSISAAAFAKNDTKSFLCIAEKGGAVVKGANGVLSSHAGGANNKYVISPSKGLRHFGIDANWLSECKYNASGRPTWCEYPGESWAGVFMMDKDNTFIITAMNLTGDMKGTEYYTVIGRCSEL